MNAGLLRHIVTFQEKSNYQNEFGEEVDYWNDVIKTRVGIFPVGGKDFFAAETVQSEVTHKIKMRYSHLIKPNMRVAFGDRHFDIISVINWQEKNIELQLMCKELV